MEVRYKLTVVSIRIESFVPSEHYEYSIGTFPDEEHLKRWAEENQGELARAYPKEEADD